MKNIPQRFHPILILSTLLLLVHGCRKNDGDPTIPPVTNTQEQITTVILNGYSASDPNDSTKHFSYFWEDTDGAGGALPNIDTLKLDTGLRYTVSLLLLDKTKTPWDTISNEIEERKNIHQFFYTPDNSIVDKLSVTTTDLDDNNPPLPVGLKLTFDTRNQTGYTPPAFGNLRVVLSHYDGIPKSTGPSPDTDLDIVFPVRLQ